MLLIFATTFVWGMGCFALGAIWSHQRDCEFPDWINHG